MAALIDINALAVGRPVGRLHVGGTRVDHHRAAELILGLNRLHGAMERHFRVLRRGRQGLQRDVRKLDFVGRIHVVRDGAKPDIERLFEM